MLKKVRTVFAALVLTLLLGNGALAGFADLELIRVYYDRAGSELGTDLGNVNTLLAAPSTTIPGSFGSLVLGTSQAAYYALDRNTSRLWASNIDAATATFTPAIIGGTTGLNAIKSGSDSLYTLYSGGSGTTYSGLALHSNSYKNKISATQGWFANTITSANSARSFSELKLDSLASKNTQTLWYWANGLATDAVGKTGVAVATIVTNPNASTTITPITTVVNGTCNPATDGQPLVAAPVASLCTTGRALSVSGSGPWNWICNGQGISGGVAGTNAACSSSQIFFISTSSLDPNSSVSCASPVAPGSNSACTITPGPGLVLSSLTDDGVDVTASASDNSYTIVNVQAGHTIVADFVAGSSKTNPTITWPAPAAITYGTPLTGTQLNATATDPATGLTVPGTFVYTPASGSVPSAATQPLSVTFTPTDTTAYATATASVDLTVNKAGLTVTAGNLSKVANTANPALTYTVTGFVNGDTAAVLAGAPALSTAAVTNSPAGGYPITITTGTLSSTNYNFTFVNGILTVNPLITPTITWPAPAAITYGTPLSGTQLNATATNPSNGQSVAGTFAYAPAAGTVLNAGAQSLSVTFTPADAVNFTTASATVNLTVNKATPTITWATPAGITYGAPLSGTQLNASATVPGTLAYTPAAGVVPNAGTQSLAVTLTPTDSTNYSAATTTVNLIVAKAALTVTANSLTKTVNTANPNLTYAVTGFVNNETAAVLTGAPGLSTTAVTNSPAGVYPINVTAGTLAAANYSMTFVSSTLTVTSRVVPVISWAVPAAITYGTALSATQLNATATDPNTSASVPGTFVYSPASGSIPAAGVQTLSVTFNPADSVTYDSVNATVSLTVNKATPTITWATPAAITYGTALSATQLNAVTGVPGTFQYTPSTGTVPAAGSQTLSALFTPTDTINYNTATASVSLTVNKAVLTVTANSLSRIVNTINPPLTYTVTGFVNSESSSVISGAPALSTTAVTNSPVGGYPITAAAGTLAAANYSFAFVDGTMTVNGQTVPTLTWTPAAISYGTPLSAAQLNATSSVPGTFQYTPPLGTVLASGPQTLTVTFIPADAVTYTSAGATVNLNVSKAVLTVTAENKSRIVNTPNPALTYTLTGFVSGETSALIGGAPLLSTTAASSSAAGSYPITIGPGTLTAANYSFVFHDGTLTVNSQINPTITWGTPASITYGNPLSATQLNATASVPGTFQYSHSAGDILNAGVQTLSVVFTPTDSVTYTGAGATVSLTVVKANPAINWAAPAAITMNTPLSAAQLNATATIPGSMVYSPALDSLLPFGNQTLSVTFTPTDILNYNSQTKTVAISVSYPSGALNGSTAPALQDALLVLRSIVGMGTLTIEQIRNADVAPLKNGKPAPDGKIDLGDALVILKRCVGSASW